MPGRAIVTTPEEVVEGVVNVVIFLCLRLPSQAMDEFGS
jgi:hypothetical protein